MKTILIVEDNEDERLHLSIILKRGKHMVIQAPNGHEAMGVLQKMRIDLVITDYRMPGMNGLDMIVAARHLPSPPEIWLVSGYLQDEIMEIARRLGADKVIWKTNLEHELIKEGLIREK